MSCGSCPHQVLFYNRDALGPTEQQIQDLPSKIPSQWLDCSLGLWGFELLFCHPSRGQWQNMGLLLCE